MTFRWKTNQIVEDLKKIPNVKEIKTYGPGGDFDTATIVVSVTKGHELYISGYVDYISNKVVPENPDDTPCQFVELNDGLDSSGGLTSKKKTTGEAYIKIRQILFR